MAKLDTKKRIKAVVRPTQEGQIHLEILPYACKGPSFKYVLQLELSPTTGIMPLCSSLSLLFPSFILLIYFSGIEYERKQKLCEYYDLPLQFSVYSALTSKLSFLLY